MDRSKSVVTPERFATGMTFDQYVAWVATPENLRREASRGSARRDWSGYLRDAFQRTQLSPAQTEAIRWLAAQPGGPAEVLMLSEEWSSDCRRDVPTVARLAEAGGLELRIFPRDGQRFSSSPRPVPGESPNGDIMTEFLNERDGQVFQSIPVAVFYTRDHRYLYHYVEFPAIYQKDRLVNGHIRAPRPGESPADTARRADQEFAALQASPFFRIWACAAVDEILSALHRRLVLGTAA